jgi:hypothetical protein
MTTITKLSIPAAVLILATSTGSAYAEDIDTTQTHIQDRIRMHVNLQTPDSDFAPTLNHEQTMVINKNQNQNQNQHQYSYMNNTSTERARTGQNSMNRYNTMNRSMQNRAVSGSGISGSMNRQNMANRSMAGGRR